ncbi:MAG TPA: cytochrome c [Opitutaceae bacterium]|nr:cytochrome c [Opitutaceae bacterium]
MQLRLSKLVVVLGALLVSTLAHAQSDAQAERGKKVFGTLCIVCHQADGKGIPSVFPPLAKSDFLMADKARSIHIAKNGLTGKITVNGASFDGVMPPTGLTNEQIADVLTYVRSSFGNAGDAVTVAEVEAALKAK